MIARGLGYVVGITARWIDYEREEDRRQARRARRAFERTRRTALGWGPMLLFLGMPLIEPLTAAERKGYSQLAAASGLLLLYLIFRISPAGEKMRGLWIGIVSILYAASLGGTVLTFGIFLVVKQLHWIGEQWAIAGALFFPALCLQGLCIVLLKRADPGGWAE